MCPVVQEEGDASPKSKRADSLRHHDLCWYRLQEMEGGSAENLSSISGKAYEKSWCAVTQFEDGGQGMIIRHTKPSQSEHLFICRCQILGVQQSY